jgi:hypothetical protein
MYESCYPCIAHVFLHMYFALHMYFKTRCTISYYDRLFTRASIHAHRSTSFRLASKQKRPHTNRLSEALRRLKSISR